MSWNRLLPSGLRSRLLLLILFTVSGSMALMFGLELHQRRTALQSAASEATLLSRLAAAHEERAVAVARQMLQGLATVEAVRYPASPSAITGVLAASLAEGHGSISALSVVTPAGRVLASTDSSAVSTDVSGTGWFRRACASHGFALGDFAPEAADARSALRCAEPVRGPDGELTAIVSATLDLDWLRRAATRARLPQHTTFVVVDRTGAVIARHPMGPRPAADSTVSAFHAQHTEWSQIVRGGDGVWRIVAFSPLEGARAHTLFVGVGMDREAVLADANRTFWRSIGWTTLLAVLVSVLAWNGAQAIVLRRVDALITATHRVRSGDLSARTGLPYGRGELSELSMAFDGMAAELQRQNRIREQAEEHLRHSEARMRAVLNASHDGILVLDSLGSVVGCNLAAERLFGARRRQLAECSLVHLFTGPAPFDPSRPSLANGIFESEARRMDGSTFPAEVSIAHVRDRSVHGLTVANVRDITERKRWERSLERMTFVDELTGLYNRRGFLMFAQQQIALAARSGRRIVLLSADLDGLKAINDQWGHAEGDRALIELAAVLRRSLRETDVVARLGGDEFVALATESDLTGAEHVLERVHDRIARRNQHGDLPWTLSASFGWTRVDPREGVELDALLAAADERMYAHKRRRGAGRDTRPEPDPTPRPAGDRAAA